MLAGECGAVPVKLTDFTRCVRAKRRFVMSLGLYVSSFYFFQSGKKKSNYLGLNSPIQYEDTQYSQAIEFFEEFF